MIKEKAQLGQNKRVDSCLLKRVDSFLKEMTPCIKELIPLSVNSVMASFFLIFDQEFIFNTKLDVTTQLTIVVKSIKNLISRGKAKKKHKVRN